MRITYYTLFFVILLQCACNFDSTSNLQILKSKVIINASKLKDPIDICIVDSIFIIGNDKTAPLIELYDKSGNLIRKIIYKGKDRFQITSIGSIQANMHNNAFYVGDLFMKKILKYDLFNTITDSLYTPENYISFKNPKDPYLICNKLVVANEFLIGENTTSKGRFAILKPTGEVVKYFLPPQKIDPSYPDMANAKLFGSCISLSPNQTKFAIGSYYAGLMNFYKINKDKATLVWSLKEFLPEETKLIKTLDIDFIAMGTNARIGFCDISSTNEYVYALFSGRKFSEKNSNFGNVIRIIKWDGSKTYEITLDKDIRDFCVNQNNSKLYGIASNFDDDPEVVEYQIKLPNNF